MVTLTNSPPTPGSRTPLENAGLAHFFKKQYNVQTVRAYKPSASVYHMVTQDLGVRARQCCLIAAHAWDTIGAQSVGMAGGLLTRPGNAALLVAGVPEPTAIAADLPTLADQLIERWKR